VTASALRPMAVGSSAPNRSEPRLGRPSAAGATGTPKPSTPTLRRNTHCAICTASRDHRLRSDAALAATRPWLPHQPAPTCRIESSAEELWVDLRRRSGCQRRDQKDVFQHGREAELRSEPLGTILRAAEDARGAYYEIRGVRWRPPLLPEGLRAGEYDASLGFTAIRVNAKPGLSVDTWEGCPSGPARADDRHDRRIQRFPRSASRLRATPRSRQTCQGRSKIDPLAPVEN
jgi:hypothetical protein